MSRLWPIGERITVQADPAGIPHEFEWQGQVHKVEGIANCWRIDEQWWRGRLWREYFKLYTTSGLLVDIYRNLSSDDWYLQRLYD